MKEKILIADDEESIRFTLASFLEDAGYRVTTAASLDPCMKQLEPGDVDLMFLDISFGRDNGLDALPVIRARYPQTRIIIITGAPQPRTLIEARQSGAEDYLAKPIRQASLLYVVKKTLAREAQGAASSSTPEHRDSSNNTGEGVAPLP